MICENCQKEHDGSYGTGRFCSDHCRRSWCAKKVKNHKCNFNAHGTHNRKPYGSWKCKLCNEIFETRAKMMEHNHKFHPIQPGSSWNKGLTKETDIRVKQYVDTNKRLLKEGKIIPGMKGKHLTQEDKKKKRIAAIKHIETLVGPFKTNYNKNSIPILNQISKEHNWNLQHAENGGEIEKFGYFLDAYDSKLNIVVEYDEPRHYVDVKNNILKDKDIERQNYIIEHLHCQFYRYNEKTKQLWKVN